MLTKSLIDDFGFRRICWKWYRESAHVLHTAGRDTGKKCIVVGEYFCEETNLWWAVGVWADSPESGPRLTWAM